MKKLFLVLMVGGLFAIGCDKDDDNNTDNSNTLNSTDRTFITKAYSSNAAEIELGQLATVSDNDSIADYAQMMVTEHTSANVQLKAIADSLSVSVSDSLDAAGQALRTQLQSLTGREFDSVYIKSQVTMHQDAITVYNEELANGQHVRVKSFASTLLPTIQNHKAMADSIALGFQ